MSLERAIACLSGAENDTLRADALTALGDQLVEEGAARDLALTFESVQGRTYLILRVYPILSDHEGAEIDPGYGLYVTTGLGTRPGKGAYGVLGVKSVSAKGGSSLARWSVIGAVLGDAFAGAPTRQFAGQEVLHRGIKEMGESTPLSALLEGLDWIARLVEHRVRFWPGFEPTSVIIGSARAEDGSDSAAVRAEHARTAGAAWWETAYPMSGIERFRKELLSGAPSFVYLFGRAGLPDWRARIVDVSQDAVDVDGYRQVAGSTSRAALDGKVAFLLTEFSELGKDQLPWGDLVKKGTENFMVRPNNSQYSRAYVHSARWEDHVMTESTDKAIGGAVSEAGEKGDAALVVPDDLLARKVADLLRSHTNVVVEGVAGSGKSHLFRKLSTDLFPERTELLVFHPSTSYEDFVVGLRPVGTNFEAVEGAFLRQADLAVKNPEERLLFIDEINRANTARVMGDLMLPLEKSKRVSREDLQKLAGRGIRSAVLSDAELAIARDLVPGLVAVRLQTDLKRKYRHLIVPENLLVLGTMNSTDRSVGTIDLALRRRFFWHSVEPLQGAQLRRALQADGASDSRLDELADVIDWHELTNQKLLAEVGPDARLGHSYFFGSSSAQDVTAAVLAQLAEMAGSFGLDPLVLASLFATGTQPDAEPGNGQHPPPLLPSEQRVIMAGHRMGRRPTVVDLAWSLRQIELAARDQPEQSTPASEQAPPAEGS